MEIARNEKVKHKNILINFSCFLLLFTTIKSMDFLLSEMAVLVASLTTTASMSVKFVPNVTLLRDVTIFLDGELSQKVGLGSPVLKDGRCFL